MTKIVLAAFAAFVIGGMLESPAFAGCTTTCTNQGQCVTTCDNGWNSRSDR